MSRPPALRGLRELDTNQMGGFVRDVGNALNALTWANMPAVPKVLDVTTTARWTDATLENSWATATGYGDPGYRIDSDGVVHLRGAADSGTYGSSAIFTLPAGYRPADPVSFPAAQSNATFEPSGRVNISTAGVVTAPAITSIQTGTSTFLSFEGISFEAADPSTAEIDPFPLYMRVDSVAEKIQSVLVTSCFDLTSGTPVPAALPGVAWSLATVNGVPAVRFASMPGLQPERRYKVGVVALGF